MRVRFRDNIGSRDAGSFGLDFRDCTKAAELEVSEETGAGLVRQNLADDVSEPAPVLRGVPPDDELQTTHKTHKAAKKK